MSAKFSYLILFVGLLLFGLAAFIVFPLLLGPASLPSREPIPLASFLENPRNFDGNRYRISGTISEQLARTPELGRLVLVEVIPDGRVVPLFLPATLDTNLSPGQRFEFNIHINQGLLHVQELRKL
jgi:hypothetical protein